MKVNTDDISGKIVKNNGTYIVIDNTSLQGLVVSKTILHPNKETTGHTHPGQEEVYQFVHGRGVMMVADETFPVRPGDVVLIPDGAFHKVFNDSSCEDLTFVCVFDGKRNH
ncbi:MAG: cupin [Halobacteriovorax sp.]|nr:cupin [Halobacteriovorax sp.]|tara:strand:- start:1913 stop:2245 length:333 start_codon:yes stop_codon:yes gene_type:complete